MNDKDLKMKLREMREFCEAKIVANPLASVILLFLMGVITGAAFKP